VSSHGVLPGGRPLQKNPYFYGVSCSGAGNRTRTLHSIEHCAEESGMASVQGGGERLPLPPHKNKRF
jgi:hypothetical protein